ncbi:MAG: hypothetical protein FWC00_02430 [Firmicutes bacterium]|nr:hypothetical protein [Bacillota bacterium]
MDEQYDLLRIKEMAHEIGVLADKILSGYRTPISELGLSSRAQNALTRGKVEYVEQLMKLSEDDLLRFRGMGEKTLNEIMGAIKH